MHYQCTICAQTVHKMRSICTQSVNYSWSKCTPVQIVQCTIYTMLNMYSVQYLLLSLTTLTPPQVRGVRVLPELDAPAHSGNGYQWGEEEGLGKLAVCVNRDPWEKYCVEPPCGQMNLANPNLYDVVEVSSGELERDITVYVCVDKKGPLKT